MGGLIPDSFIEELLGRVDIVEVIERRVPLKKAGREYQARCPFHDEKTPSFTVSPQKQFYHCFGCGAHGSVIGFMMNYEGLEFVDAVEELARMAGLQVPRDTATSAPRPAAGLYDLLQEAGAWYQAQLKQNPQAIEYLKRRGLSGEVAARFEVGYAPAGWDGLIKQLGVDDNRLKLLHRAGMLSEGKNGAYDKFRDRIMFPIHDRRGRIIAFGGRALADDGPKYLNSPETELFHKGRELYGLYMARKSRRSWDRSWLWKATWTSWPWPSSGSTTAWRRSARRPPVIMPSCCFGRRMRRCTVSMVIAPGEKPPGGRWKPRCRACAKGDRRDSFSCRKG